MAGGAPLHGCQVSRAEKIPQVLWILIVRSITRVPRGCKFYNILGVDLRHFVLIRGHT
jgi:hypothetical protein